MSQTGGFVPFSPVHVAELIPSVPAGAHWGHLSCLSAADGGAIMVQQKVATDVTHRQLK